MTPNKEDIKYLNEFLDKELVYRETYNEMQDHILSALEQYPEDVPFQSAFHDIINTQFKGTVGLRAIDRQCRKHGVTEMRNRYFAHIVDMFKFPSVIYLALVSIAAFFFFSYMSSNVLAHIGVFVVVASFPGIINVIRYIRTGYHYGSTKRSVADDGFRFLKYFPGVIYAVFMLLLWQMNFKPVDIFRSISPGIATLIFLTYFLHAVAFFKMYKQEFKFNMAK